MTTVQVHLIIGTTLDQGRICPPPMCVCYPRDPMRNRIKSYLKTVDCGKSRPIFVEIFIFCR